MFVILYGDFFMKISFYEMVVFDEVMGSGGDIGEFVFFGLRYSDGGEDFYVFF